jgi:hypothetical protein
MPRAKKIKCEDKPLIEVDELDSWGDNYMQSVAKLSELIETNRVHFIKEDLKFGYDRDFENDMKLAGICIFKLHSKMINNK